MKISKIIVVVFLLGMVGYALWEGIINKPAATGVEIGNQAPDFSLQQMDSTNVKLSSFIGKKVILNFWASWCGPCEAEMPEMQVFHEESGEEVVILAVNLTTTEKGLDTVTAYVKEKELAFPILLDVTGTVNNTYQVYSLPTSFFIDTKGIIQHKVVGAMTLETMKKYTDKMD
ncbi:redoxin domain-containing protein [Bacillus timonensis]|nr:redoxin domain-containing protein [Bacillus timonensis]